MFDRPEKDYELSGVPDTPIEQHRAWKVFLRGVTTLAETRYALLDAGYPIDQVNKLVPRVDAVDVK